jgi:hypothetical protein
LADDDRAHTFSDALDKVDDHIDIGKAALVESSIHECSGFVGWPSVFVNSFY